MKNARVVRGDPCHPRSLAARRRRASPPPTPTTTPTAPAPAPADKNPLVPPDETIWQRYSPHHEFPLSSVTSVTLHILVIVLLGLLGWIAIKLGLSNNGGLPV